MSLGAAVNQPSSDLSETRSALELRLKVILVICFGFEFDFDSKNLNVLNHLDSLCLGAKSTVHTGTLPVGFNCAEVMLFAFRTNSGSNT